MSDIKAKLIDACKGDPDAILKWPHELLREAVDCIEKSEAERDELEKINVTLLQKKAELESEVKALREVYNNAKGLCCGVDWNKGTHADIYRARLRAAVGDATALLLEGVNETEKG